MEMNAGKPLLDIKTWTLPCERQGDLYDPGSRLQDSRCRDSSEALSSQPSGLACGCRQDDVREYVITDEKKV